MKHVKIKPVAITIDARFQRELDKSRVRSMVATFNPTLVGVLVVSARANGSYVGIDGQHRREMLCEVGLGETPTLCEVHEGLSLKEEATLFLRLNGGRTAIRVFDKFKARLVAEDATATEIRRIVEHCGLAISKTPGTKHVCAIQSLESVHTRCGNLAKTLTALTMWSKNDPMVFDGDLIKYVGAFFVEYPDASHTLLAKRLASFAPSHVLTRIWELKGSSREMAANTAAIVILRGYYNKGKGGTKLPSPSGLAA